MSSFSSLDLQLAEKCVSRDLIEADIYYHLMFDFMNPMALDDILPKKCGLILKYMRDSFDTSYILVLSKIFGLPSESSLERMTLEIFRMPENVFELRLQRKHLIRQKEFVNARVEFKSEYRSNLKRIQNIRKKLSELRNIFRVHNYPKRPVKHKTIFKETEEWRDFAKKLYFTCLYAGIVENGHGINDFLREDFEGQLNFLLQHWNLGTSKNLVATS